MKFYNLNNYLRAYLDDPTSVFGLSSDFFVRTPTGKNNPCPTLHVKTCLVSQSPSPPPENCTLCQTNQCPYPKKIYIYLKLNIIN